MPLAKRVACALAGFGSDGAPRMLVRKLDFVAVRRLYESQGAITRYNKGERE